MLCNSILQRYGRRLDSSLRIVWADWTLALEPEAKDRMLHLDPSVSGGEILLFLGAGYNPFFSPPSAMLCVTNKSAFLFRHTHPLETSFFIFCRWCLLTGQGQCCQLFSHVIFQLSLVPWLCTSKITRVTRLLMEHSSCVSTLRVMGGWELYVKAQTLHLKNESIVSAYMCLVYMETNLFPHCLEFPFVDISCQSAPYMCKQQPIPCRKGIPVVKWNSSPSLIKSFRNKIS